MRKQIPCFAAIAALLVACSSTPGRTEPVPAPIAVPSAAPAAPRLYAFISDLHLGLGHNPPGEFGLL